MATKSTAKSAAATKPQRLIYVGPTLKGYKLIKYQVFIGGYPTHLDGEFEKCPQLKRLFVTVKDLVQAEKEVNTAGTPLNKYYKLVQEV